MHLHRRIKIQLALFVVVSLIALSLMTLHFMKLPAMLFGVGQYTVTVQLPKTGGLYEGGNVTYRGSEVGRVQSVQLTQTGVQAVLALKSGIDIPSDLTAEVHSQSAIGEQYVALMPHGPGQPLREGDVIAEADTTVPPDINGLLSAANDGLKAIPNDNLKTVIDESYTAVGGLGPQLSKIVQGTSDLAIDARKNLDPLLALIDKAQPVLNSQTNTSEAIQTWAAHSATITGELHDHDAAVAGVLQRGGPAAAEARQLLDRLQPTLPVLMANLVSIGQVALTYHDSLEEILVLFPQLISAEQAGLVANLNTKQAYKGQYLSFNLNVNLPPVCSTGFFPAQQQRVATYQDAPDRPENLYCRTPQDGAFNVRGAKNLPCETVPGKRAPTVALCESKETYVPLNDGFNWKGDPNATLTGQAVPQPPPGSAAPPTPTVTAVPYDPASGTYVGPDGKQYTQTDLASAGKPQSWQDMVMPPGAK